MALSFRTSSLNACTSGNAVSTGMTVVAGDMVFATISQNGAAAKIITSASLTDSAGNTWTLLTGPLTESHTASSASSITFYSVITTGATLSITPTIAPTGGTNFLLVDCITGFTGTATLDPGGVEVTGSSSTSTTGVAGYLPSGTAHQAVEMAYAVFCAGGTLSTSTGNTFNNLTGAAQGSSGTLTYSSADCVISVGYLTSAAATVTSTVFAGWTTARVYTSFGILVYDATAASVSGTGSLHGTGVLGGSSTVSISGTDHLIGTGVLGGNSTVSQTGTGVLSGSGVLSGTATVTVPGTGVLSGTGTLPTFAAVNGVVNGTLAPGAPNDPAYVISLLQAGWTWDGGASVYYTNGIDPLVNLTIQNATLVNPTQVHTATNTDGSSILEFANTSPLPVVNGMYLTGAGITTASVTNVSGASVTLAGSVSGLTDTAYTFSMPYLPGSLNDGTPIQPHVTIDGTQITSGSVYLNNLYLSGGNSSGTYHGNPWVGGPGISLLSAHNVTISNAVSYNTYGDFLTAFYASGGKACSAITVNGASVNGTGREGITLGWIDNSVGANTFNNVTIVACAQNAISNESDIKKIGSGSCTFNNLNIQKGGMNLISYLNGDMTFNLSGMWGPIALVDPYGTHTVYFNGPAVWTLLQNNSSNPAFQQTGGNIVVNGVTFTPNAGTQTPPLVQAYGAATNPNVAQVNLPNSTIPTSSSSGQYVDVSTLTGSTTLPISPNGNLQNTDQGASITSTPDSIVHANGFNTFTWSGGVPASVAPGLYVTGASITEPVQVQSVTTHNAELVALSGNDIGALPAGSYVFQTAVNCLTNPLLGTMTGCSVSPGSASVNSIDCVSTYTPTLGGSVSSAYGYGNTTQRVRVYCTPVSGAWAVGMTVNVSGLGFLYANGTDLVITEVAGDGSWFQYFNGNYNGSTTVSGALAYQALILLGVTGFTTGGSSPGNPNGGPWPVTYRNGSLFRLQCGSGQVPSGGPYSSGSGFITQQGTVSAVLAYNLRTGTNPSTYAIGGVKTLFGSGLLFNGTGGTNSDVGVLRQQYQWIPASFSATGVDLSAIPLENWGVQVDDDPRGYSSVSIVGTL